MSAEYDMSIVRSINVLLIGEISREKEGWVNQKSGILTVEMT